jgi:hypothetical protein
MEQNLTIDQLIEFLYYAHIYNFLNKRIVDGLTQSFDVDVNDLCRQKGITYNL